MSDEPPSPPPPPELEPGEAYNPYEYETAKAASGSPQQDRPLLSYGPFVLQSPMRMFGPRPGQWTIVWQALTPRAGELPARDRRMARVVVGCLVGVVLLCCGGTGWLSRGVWTQYPATIVTPESVIGVPRRTEPELQETARNIANQNKAAQERDVVVAYYAERDDVQHIIAFMGETRLILFPDRRLDSEMAQVERDVGAPLRELRDVDPGPLGGGMRCGVAGSGEVSASICVWTDHGSVGMGIFLNRTATDAADLMRAIRAEVLRR